MCRARQLDSAPLSRVPFCSMFGNFVSEVCWRPQFVFTIPAERVGFERRDHFWKRLAKRTLRLPTKHRARASDVQLVMIVGKINHPWFDKWIFDQRYFILNPSARLGERLRDFTCLPLFAVDEPAKDMLQLVISE